MQNANERTTCHASEAPGRLLTIILARLEIKLTRLELGGPACRDKPQEGKSTTTDSRRSSSTERAAPGDHKCRPRAYEKPVSTINSNLHTATIRPTVTGRALHEVLLEHHGFNEIYDRSCRASRWMNADYPVGANQASQDRQLNNET